MRKKNVEIVESRKLQKNIEFKTGNEKVKNLGNTRESKKLSFRKEEKEKCR